VFLGHARGNLRQDRLASAGVLPDGQPKRCRFLVLTTMASRNSVATIMARKIRVQCPGAIYPLMNRGDRKEAIFRDDSDRSLFLETLGQACASSAGRKEFEKQMKARRWEREPEEWKRSSRRGWFLGDDAFRKDLMEAMDSRMGAEHYREERPETGLAKAERIVVDELKQRRWNSWSRSPREMVRK
jgi:hypothetical protein